MKHHILFFIFAFAVAILSLIIGFSNTHQNPFDQHLEFDYPQFSNVDENNNLYVIDTSLRRIIVIDKDQNLLSAVYGGDRNEGSLYYARNITAGNSDNFFVLNYVLDDFGMFLLREEIIEYDLSGKFQRIVYQRKYSNKRSTLVQRGEIYNPIVFGNMLYFFLVDGYNIRMLRHSLQVSSIEILAEFEVEDANAFVSDIEWLNTEEFIILDKRGFLLLGNISSSSLRQVGFEPQEPNQSIQQINPVHPKEYFTDLAVSRSGNIYLTDLINRQIVSIPLREIQASYQLESEINTLRYHPILTADIFNSALEIDESNYIFYRVGDTPQGFVTTYDFGVYIGDERGNFSVQESVRIPRAWVVTSFLRWAGYIIGGITVIALIFYIYIVLWKKKLSILLKQLLIIVPIFFGGIVLMANILLQIYINQYRMGNIDKLLSLTQVMSKSVNGNLFKSVQNLDDYMNEEYREIRASLQESLNYNQDIWNEGLYFALYQVIDDELYGFMYLNNEIGIRHPFTWYDDPESVYRLAYSGQVVYEQAEDISGNFLYAISPIYDDNAQTVALLEVGTDLFSFELNVRRTYRQASIFLFVIATAFVLVIMIMTYLILRNLGILRRGVEQVAEGDWNHTINIKSNDEFQELGERFNSMSSSINNYVNHIAALSDSYRRFFPDQFLTHLDLESITEVKLGDQVQKVMTILFSDIRSFTSISEKLTPEQNFNFLNEYLDVVAPIVKNNEGFIDKFIGDAVMALFAETPMDAINSAVSMLEGIKHFNVKQVQKGYPEIQIGIGIHTGNLMLGVLGDKHRMEGTVIADSVNFAARLESLTKQIGASIIVSEDSLKFETAESYYIKRYLGKIQVVGKSDAVRVYEILNGLPEVELEAKLRVKIPLFEGIRCYEQGDLQTAISHFVSIQNDPANSKLASFYLLAIEEYFELKKTYDQKGIKIPKWEGVLKASTK